MSARIITFPGSHRHHSQEVIEAALRVRAIALAVFEQNGPRHRINAFERAIKTLLRRCQLIHLPVSRDWEGWQRSSPSRRQRPLSIRRHSAQRTDPTAAWPLSSMLPMSLLRSKAGAPE